MWNLILKAAMSYLESHPDKIAELIGLAVDQVIADLHAKKAARG